MYLKKGLHIKGILLPIFLKRQFQFIYLSAKSYWWFIHIEYMLYMIFKKTVVTFLYFRKHSSHDHCRKKWGDSLSAVIVISLILFYGIVLNQIFHTWFDWNLVNGCSLHEENSMDKLKAAMIFIVFATYSSPWKNSKHHSVKSVE